MDRHVTMPLLETIVFSDVVEVIPSDNNCSLHFHLDNCTSQDSTSDGNTAGEWTLLVDVLALDSLSGNLETETDISCVSQLLLGDLLLHI